MKFILLIWACLLLPAWCAAHMQYVYICTKEGVPIVYRDAPCPPSYQQKIIARWVKPLRQVPVLNTDNQGSKTRHPKKNNSINKAKKSAEQQRRLQDRCDSVKERMAIIEDKYKTGYKPKQKIRLDRNMQTLRRLHKKYCGR